MHLYDYINEICTISDNNNHVMRDAIDMFLNNIDDAHNSADQYKYKGSDGFDYAALVPFVEQLRDERSAMWAVANLHDVELQELHDAGKYDEAIALAKKCYDDVVSASSVSEGVDSGEAE